MMKRILVGVLTKLRNRDGRRRPFGKGIKAIAYTVYDIKRLTASIGL